jgi:uncharacterized membrane protein YhiD involved in acid resistance
MEELLLKILISLALGALIGMERERRMKESFAGFRTFMLVCFIWPYFKLFVFHSIKLIADTFFFIRWNSCSFKFL